MKYRNDEDKKEGRYTWNQFLFIDVSESQLI